MYDFKFSYLIQNDMVPNNYFDLIMIITFERYYTVSTIAI